MDTVWADLDAGGDGAIAALLAYGETANAETVIAKRRLGNNVESITYDPLNDRAVAIDGNDVIGIALNPFDSIVLATRREETGGIEGPGFRKLFDVLALPPEARAPRGIAHLPAARKYVFTSLLPGGTDAFYVTDEAGHPRPPIALKGLAQPVDIWEGISWIPAGAPARGGTLAALGARYADNQEHHLFYVRLDGTVEQELVPQPGTPIENYLCAVAYQPAHPTQLLIGDCFSGVFAMDARTGMIGSPQPLFPNSPGVADAEGIVVRRDGSVYLSGYEEGRLFAHDAAYHRKASDVRGFVIGLGTSFPRVAWNNDTNEFLLLRPELPNGRRLARLVFQGPAFPPGAAFAPRGFGMRDPDTFIVRANGDATAPKVVTRSSTPDSSVFPDGVIPNRFPDIVLSQPTNGLDVSVFGTGAGKQIFTGAEIYGWTGLSFMSSMASSSA